MSDKLPAEELGIFANAFHLTNYEYSHKTAPKIEKEEDEKARAEADFDERTRKHGKVIPKVSIVSKDGDISDIGFWNVSAKATRYARDLTNTRGSVATPDYMEEEVRKLIKDQPSIKDFRVIKGQ